MTTYLIAGGRDVDAGKTTFSVGLLAHVGGTGFKPRAGNDVWFHHDDYQRAITEGRLYGKDAHRLAEASATDVEPEDINPIHRLWRPAPGGDGFIGATDREFVLDRIGEGFVVNASVTVPRSANRNLSIENAPRVDTIDALNEQIRARHLPHLRALANRVAECDHAVVESYGDIARPLQNITPDRVAVVEPGRARIYDGERYRRACEVASGRVGPQTGRLEERVADVVGLIDPVATASLPPLRSDTRGDPDAVADAYAGTYQALLG